MRNWKGEKKEMINRGLIERMKLRIEGRGVKRSDRMKVSGRVRIQACEGREEDRQ